jgi:hypothetical protein
MTHQGLQLHVPATYQIRVQGCVPENWADRLGGMTITTNCDSDEPPETTLSGRLADQAALFGVLTTLYDLHRPILSVECSSHESNQI